MNKKKILFLLPFILLSSYFIYRSYSYPPSDFANYYYSAKFLLKKDLTKEDYFPQVFNKKIKKESANEIYSNFTPHPPFISILFIPFTVLNLANAKIVLNILSIILACITLLRCIKYFRIEPYYLIILPILFFIPLRSNILFGQVYILLIILLIEGYIAYLKNKTILSSIYWGIAILFKLFPGILFLFLLAQKKWKQLILLSISCSVLFIISIIINGIDIWNFFLKQVLPRANRAEINDSYIYLFQSFYVFLKNLFVKDALANPTPLIDNPYLFLFFIGIIKAIIIAMAVMMGYKKNINPFYKFSYLLLASLLISPIGSTYSLIILLPCFLFICSNDFVYKNKKLSFILLLLLFLVSNLPINYFKNYYLIFNFPRLYLLALFFGVLYYQLKVKFNIYLFSCIAGLVILISFVKYKDDRNSSSYLLNSNSHPLIYDYTIKRNKLIYTYWDATGSHEYESNVNLEIDSLAEKPFLKNNQIYLKNQQFTFSDDQKRKPMLLANHKEIIYLSDKNRGFGFFTFRKIQLPN